MEKISIILPMATIKSILFGMMTGISDCLPISGSGHLLLWKHFLGSEQVTSVLSASVHLGVIAAVVIYFLKDLFRIVRDTFLFVFKFPMVRNADEIINDHPYALIGGMILFASIVTAMFGFVFWDGLKMFLGSLPIAAVGWFITGALLLAGSRYPCGIRNAFELNHQDGFMIGLAQGAGIIPGISRTGATVMTGFFLGFEKEVAVRFSFWLALPMMIGAGFFEMRDGIELTRVDMIPALAGFFAAFLSSLCCIPIVLRLIRNGKFFIFGYYCILIGLFTLAENFLRVRFF